MSSAALTGLPRFDTEAAAGTSSGPSSWLRELDSKAVPDAARKAPQDVQAATGPAPAAMPAVESPALLDLKKIEASLAALNSKLDKIERDAQAQALQTVQSMAAKLFPELSRHFLAEEIARHLPGLVPDMAAVIEIRAEAELAGKLTELVERLPALTHRCTVTPTEAEGQGRVDVSWQTGGVTFDFDGLLQGCLSHLTSTQTVTKE
ncbi:MAG: hypothetical protein RLO80_03360 [Hyphomonas sp.]